MDKMKYAKLIVLNEELKTTKDPILGMLGVITDALVELVGDVLDTRLNLAIEKQKEVNDGNC
jgi:hypothetical protein